MRDNVFSSSEISAEAVDHPPTSSEVMPKMRRRLRRRADPVTASDDLNGYLLASLRAEFADSILPARSLIVEPRKERARGRS